MPRLLAISTICGELSIPYIDTPRDLRCRASTPVPQPRSSTKLPLLNNGSIRRQTADLCDLPTGVSDQSASYRKAILSKAVALPAVVAIMPPPRHGSSANPSARLVFLRDREPAKAHFSEGRLRADRSASNAVP